jgi:hypothetical protein
MAKKEQSVDLGHGLMDPRRDFYGYSAGLSSGFDSYYSADFQAQVLIFYNSYLILLKGCCNSSCSRSFPSIPWNILLINFSLGVPGLNTHLNFRRYIYSSALALWTPAASSFTIFASSRATDSGN